ncbi:hypothetical protein [Pseudoruegeria sp. HB172150]|uniref:hypothetical protein n=1 Tax=Pseudoruegeria sp. HB172150 TaxID=2721164 RepID=UPI001555288E|nr:hypothetical protein [Pseudoruegeria sp. HB172150]
MLVRRLPPATIKLKNGCHLTLSKRITGTTAKVAHSSAVRALQQYEKAEDAEELLEIQHQNLDLLDELIAAATLIAENLLSAIRMLEGNPTDGTGPVVENAATTRALADALGAAVPEFDLGELDETLQVLRSTYADITQDLDTAIKRREKLDMVLREGTAIVIAHADRPARLFELYELPHELSVATSDNCKALCKSYLSRKEIKRQKDKANRRDTLRRDIASKVARIWEGDFSNAR